MLRKHVLHDPANSIYTRCASVSVDKQISYWLEANRKKPVYKFGSQPPLLLTFYRKYEPMSESWNFRHLGTYLGCKERSHTFATTGTPPRVCLRMPSRKPESVVLYLIQFMPPTQAISSR